MHMALAGQDLLLLPGAVPWGQAGSGKDHARLMEYHQGEQVCPMVMYMREDLSPSPLPYDSSEQDVSRKGAGRSGPTSSPPVPGCVRR